jgi:hypothetical protein
MNSISRKGWYKLSNQNKSNGTKKKVAIVEQTKWKRRPSSKIRAVRSAAGYKFKMCVCVVVLMSQAYIPADEDISAIGQF